MIQDSARCPPWLAGSAQRLLSAAAAWRLHHALLLTGVPGIGKRVFGQWLAEALLCKDRTEQGACGNCSACKQRMADAHPDFLTLLPEGANAGIKIDTIRHLVDWLQLTAGQGSYRVAFITEANGLNRYAANSLLKTLEEPADNAVLILCADRVGALPATVVSRCQKINLKVEERAAAVDWLSTYCDQPEQALSEADGAPFKAIYQLEEQYRSEQVLLAKAWSDLFLHKGSVGRIADSLSKLETSVCLRTFSKWATLAAKERQHVHIAGNLAILTVISDTCDQLDSEQWFTFHDRLLQLYRADSASFKTQTVLEGIFADTRLMINS